MTPLKNAHSNTLSLSHKQEQEECGDTIWKHLMFQQRKRPLPLSEEGQFSGRHGVFLAPSPPPQVNQTAPPAGVKSVDAWTQTTVHPSRPWESYK